MDLSNVEAVQVVSKEDPFPITPKEHGVEFLMDYRHLWIRSTRQRAILKIRHEIVKAVRDFFDDNGFTLCDAPILTPAACEGTTTLFEVGYFEDKAYLTQSGQLYSEATAAALGKVYTFGPTFRAEKSKTRRHLTEFWMVEPEVAYATVDDIMDLAEKMLCFVVQRVLEKRQPELEGPRARHLEAGKDRYRHFHESAMTKPWQCCRRADQKFNGAETSAAAMKPSSRSNSTSR